MTRRRSADILVNTMNDTSFKNQIVIFTDGACSGNPGKGGWGAVIYFPRGHIQELGGSSFHTTNNKMEMSATIEALKKIRAADGDQIWLYTDSTYVIRGITQWIWGWKKKGWINAEGGEVTNQELWKDLEREVMRLKKINIAIDWRYVRGHTGVPGNERVDQIAVAFSQRQDTRLFDGPLLQYDVALLDLPDSHELPPMREKTEKKEAYSYLSYVGAEVLRHKTWKGCEAQVKGRSGAKFKKAMSPEDENQILKEWGVSADRLKNSSEG